MKVDVSSEGARKVTEERSGSGSGTGVGVGVGVGVVTVGGGQGQTCEKHECDALSTTGVHG